MKPYIYSIIFLLGAQFSFGQTTEVLLKESFPANENTILNLDLDNVAIVFEESFDNKIHFDYTMIFGRYSKRKRDIIKNQSKIETSKKGDLINLKVINSQFLGINTSYIPNYITRNKDSFLVSMKDFIKYERKRKYLYKTKDSLLSEIKLSEGGNLENFYRNRYRKFRDNDALKNKKVIVKIFSIKLPKYVKLRVRAIQTDVNFTYDITEPIVVNSFQGFLKFKNIVSKNNSINSNNGILQAYSFNNGELDFRDMRKITLGSISNTRLRTETSKIQIGEIKENVSITDFNGKYHFYNFSDDFKETHLKGDYTELNLYKVKESNYAMNVLGLKSTLNLDGVKTTFGSSDSSELTKILEKKSKQNSLNVLKIELKNGILNIR